MPSEHFEVFLADQEQARRIHFKLRYQVFCTETGYENPEDYPDGEEKDEWDANAAHFLVRARDSGRWVATMRIVLPRSGRLPIENRTTLDDAGRALSGSSAEISRLCMVGHYRRRLQGRMVPCYNEKCSDPRANLAWAEVELEKRRRTTEILRVLMDAAIAYSREQGIRHWYMLTTRALAKIAGHVLPMDLQQVGPACSHRGERYPFLTDVHAIINRMAESVGDLFHDRAPSYRHYSDVVSLPYAVNMG